VRLLRLVRQRGSREQWSGLARQRGWLLAAAAAAAVEADRRDSPEQEQGQLLAVQTDLRLAVGRKGYSLVD